MTYRRERLLGNEVTWQINQAMFLYLSPRWKIELWRKVFPLSRNGSWERYNSILHILLLCNFRYPSRHCLQSLWRPGFLAWLSSIPSVQGGIGGLISVQGGIDGPIVMRVALVWQVLLHNYPTKWPGYTTNLRSYNLRGWDIIKVSSIMHGLHCTCLEGLIMD